MPRRGSWCGVRSSLSGRGRPLLSPAALLLASMLPVAALAALSVECPSGLRAVIYTAEEIKADMLVRERGRSWLQHPSVGLLELLNGTDDPRLLRANVTDFQPFPADVVIAALNAMHDIAPVMEVNIFLLPAPPADPQSSFSWRNVVLLAPGFGPPAASTVAYVTTHELGHVLSWAYLDPVPSRWSAYRQLRGLEGSEDGIGRSHAERPREILAEDIRYLFGGSLATISGTIENHDLPTPDRVTGLRELLAGYLQGPPVPPYLARSHAFPNPCNPATTVELLLPEEVVGAATGGELDLYDVRGRLVRRLPGGRLQDGRLSIDWDGRDGSGRPAASGRYLYVIRVGSVHSRGAVLLVR
jgi:hypothetical protein